MPYKPGTINESDRTKAYTMLWFGFPDSIILLIATIFGADLLAAPTAGFAAGTMLVGFRAGDEVVEKQVSFASRWAASVAGMCLLAATFPFSRDYPMNPAIAFAVVAVVYHGALTWQRLKDR